MFQVILGMQNPEFFPIMLGIVLDSVCYTLQLTNILLNNAIKSNLSNVICSEIDQAIDKSMDKFVEFLAILVV